VTPREKLQFAYELAFFPPRFHEVWNRFRADQVNDPVELAELVDMALALHQALPETGYASPRALKRLAMYQAKARAFGTVACLRNLRGRLNVSSAPLPLTVPGAMVRDIGLPEFTRSRP
jgi:hypothetical protein